MLTGLRGPGSGFVPSVTPGEAVRPSAPVGPAPSLGASVGPSLGAPDAPRTEARPSARGVASTLAGLVRPAVLAVMLGASALSSVAAADGVRGAPLGVVQRVAAPVVDSTADAKLSAALTAILAADANGDGKVVGGRLSSELGGLDPLARAVYDYVDFVNPRGSYSLWGADSRGDYVSGGFGAGFRPQHMSAQQVLLRSDLEQGVRELSRALATRRADAPADDLAAIRARTGASPGEISAAVERVLDDVRAGGAAKALEARRSDVLLTHAEARARHAEGSLERVVLEVIEGRGAVHFAPALARFGAERARLAAAPGHVGEAELQYLHLVGKLAREAELVDAVRAAMR